MGAVLIIDDMEDLRYSLSALVRKEGYAAFSAPDGAGALDTAATSVIDLIFLDIGLPDTDGISLIGRLKEINPDVDIVMLTGINDAKTAVDCLRAGAVDHIAKPFELIEFRSILNRIMQSRLIGKQARLETAEVGIDRILGACEAMRRVKEAILMAAELANGGTLFLDEIGNLPISLQPKLLRLIEESTFRRVGGIKDIQVQVRIIAATNAAIEEEIDLGHQL